MCRCVAVSVPELACQQRFFELKLKLFVLGVRPRLLQKPASLARTMRVCSFTDS